MGRGGSVTLLRVYYFLLSEKHGDKNIKPSMTYSGNTQLIEGAILIAVKVII
jgi:hypothetical protein